MKKYKDCQKTECKLCNENNCYCKNPVCEEPSKVVQIEKKVIEEIEIKKSFHIPKKV